MTAQPTQSRPVDPEPMQRIGDWTLDSRLGSGGFGSVWSARNRRGVRGALKLIDTPPGDELRALASVVHPNVPAVLDAGALPRPYLVMEIARGRALHKIIKAARAPESAANRVLAALADAIAAVHGAGVIHGDIKPANVVVGRITDGEVKLVDFGMVGLAGGTLAYASPERLAGAAASPAADVYALGLVVWEMLHGSLPGAEGGLSSIVAQRRRGPPTSTLASPWLAQLLEAMLATDPARRPTASTVCDTLAAHGFHAPPPDPTSLRRRAGGAHVAVDAVDRSINRWVDQGGRLSLSGLPGSGRTHAIERAITELRAVGRVHLRLESGGAAWAAVAQALSSTALPGVPVNLPEHPDPETRVVIAAQAMVARCEQPVWLLVDDLETLAQPDADFLRALAGQPTVHLLTTRTADNAAGTVPLLALAPGQIQALIAQILGSTPPAPLVAVAAELSGGWPRSVVDVVVAAATAGALLQRNGRWLVDEASLDSLVASGGLSLGETAEQLPAEADPDVAALLALSAEPLSLAELGQLMGSGEAATSGSVDALIDAGLVLLEGDLLRCASRRARTSMAAAAPTAPLHLRLARHRLAQADSLDPRAAMGLASHLVGAADAALAAQEGARILALAGELDALPAARMAEPLAALAPTPELVAVAADLLRRAGQLDAARALAEGWLGSNGAGIDSLPVRVALVRAFAEADPASPDADDAIQAARRLCPLGSRLELDAVEAGIRLLREEVVEAAAVARTVVAHPAPDSPADIDHWLAAHGTLAQALRRQGKLDTGLAVLDKIPPEVGLGRRSRALLQATRGLLLWHAGRMRDAATALGQAGAQRAGLSLRDRARTLNNAAAAWYQCGDRARAVACWEEALLIFERLNQRLEQVRVQTNLCLGYCRLGRWERSRQAGQWAVNVAQELQNDEYAAMASGNLGDVAAAQGHNQEADHYFNLAESIAKRAGLAGELVELSRRRLELSLRSSPSAAPLAEARSSWAVAQDGDARLEAARIGTLIGVCEARLGNAAAARTALEAAETELRTLGAAGELAASRLWSASAALALHDPASARAHLERVAPYVEEVGDVPLRDWMEGLRIDVDARLASQRSASGSDAALLDLAVTIAREHDLQRVLDRVCEVALELVDGQRAFVILDEDGPKIRAGAHAPGVESDEPSMSVVRNVLDSRREVIVADMFERDDLRAAQSVMALSLRSAMALPLIHGDHLLGAIYVDSQHTTETELNLRARGLRALASHVAVAVVNARLIAGARARAARGAELAHDFRSPVSGILAAIDQLEQDSLLSPDVAEALEVIRRMGKRAYDLAEGFLRQDQQRRDPIDLSTLLVTEVETLRPSARRAGVSLLADIADDIVVRGDASDLGRVLANLVGNAIKYTPEGGQITVSLQPDADGVCLSVQDTGPGLPEALLPRIFDRGSQAADAKHGYGLGMAIVARITQQHGGHATAGNAEAGGAVFRIWLPTIGAIKNQARAS